MLFFMRMNMDRQIFLFYSYIVIVFVSLLIAGCCFDSGVANFFSWTANFIQAQFICATQTKDFKIS